MSWAIRLLAAQCSIVTTVAAQGTVVGFVRDRSTGKPIAGVEVTVEAPARAVRTDSAGGFVLRDIPAGLRVVRTRILGYTPTNTVIQLTDGVTQSRDILLDRAAVQLDSVRIIARNQRLREFDDDRRIGLGHTVTAAELEARHVQRVVEVFDAFASSRPSRGDGSSAWIASSRPRRVIRPDLADRMRGATPACYANVYLDGAQVYHGRDEEPLFDINSIPVDQIEGIEYFAGPAETPIRYSSLDMSCGVVVIWTKRN